MSGLIQTPLCPNCRLRECAIDRARCWPCLEAAIARTQVRHRADGWAMPMDETIERCDGPAVNEAPYRKRGHRVQGGARG